jgi:hypothetical protein
MKIDNIKNFTEGWFIGNFEPSILKTNLFEVCYKKHYKDEQWPIHYHKIATEINYLIKGSMIIQGKQFQQGDIFTIYPNEIADPTFLEDCDLIVVKIPSIQGDKYNIE